MPESRHKKTPTGTKVEAVGRRQAPFSCLFYVAAIRSKSPRDLAAVFTACVRSQGGGARSNHLERIHQWLRQSFWRLAGL